MVNQDLKLELNARGLCIANIFPELGNCISKIRYFIAKSKNTS